MAVSLGASSYSCLSAAPGSKDPPFKLSCKFKVCNGLKSQTVGTFCITQLNANAIFHARVLKGLSARNCNKRYARLCITMMPIGTPRVPYKTPGERSWQLIDLWNALYRERVIFIGQHITEESSNQILTSMLYLDSIESKKMHLYINSPGGDITPSMSIYDTMLSLSCPITTHCFGHAYNMAGFLLAAGQKGTRTTMPLSIISLQQPAGAARGQADDMRIEANELLRIRHYLYGELAKQTGQPVEKIYEDLAHTKHFKSKEAYEYGLVDRILRPIQIKRALKKDEQIWEGETGLGS
ncbi:hypothetical protein HPP92_003182 [Vanilla planifolia]|uniref:ATP-dependent Clp protease proteolytic subunit n=1 Tax=Vanilla planifolia TaxID=51239 RepID=A0A835S215_VANPL|nr:hypothetical protein HPP92_003576 [Vanilla planifolia]KAG0503110.1 hypothetical protein HPP92_003182 [Vanilla planifolia]